MCNLADKSLRLGILADSSVELGQLVAQLKSGPHSVVCSALTKVHSPPLREDVDAWVVRIANHCEAADNLLDWIYEHDIPIVIQDADAERKPAHVLASKVSEVVAAHKRDGVAYAVPKFVWVLAASTGGPEAVIEFLETLGNRAPNCSFIYAQHIDNHALSVLHAALSAKASLSIDYCKHGEFIECNHVYIVAPEAAFDISENNRFIVSGEPWKGPYQPSINQVIAKVARVYRERSGAIVFTGMGDDGAESARLMQAVGGCLYVQTLDSCTVDSMPKCASESAQVMFSGTPKQLANKVTSLNLGAGKPRLCKAQ